MGAVRQKDDVYNARMINILCLQHLRQEEFLASQFRLGPVTPGHALTIANTLRRSLLCEINAAAFICAFFPYNEHEYEHIPGVQETVHDVLFNLKKVKLKTDFELFPPQKAVLDFLGPGRVYAHNIELPCFLTCVNPNFVLAHVTEKAHFRVELLVGSGHGSVAPLADQQKDAFHHYVAGFQSLQQQREKTKRNAWVRQRGRGDKAPPAYKPAPASALREATQGFESHGQQGLRLRPTPKTQNFEGKPGSLWRLRRQFALGGGRATSRRGKKNHRRVFQRARAPQRALGGSLGFERTYRLTSKTRSQLYNLVLQTLPVLPSQGLASKPFGLRPKPHIDTRGYFVVPSVFSPIVRVNYRIEDDASSSLPMEHIFMEIWSNGTLSPKQALHEAAYATMSLFAPFQNQAF